MHPSAVEPGIMSYVVLALSFCIDGFVMLSALRAIWAKKGSMGLFAYLRTTTDPTVAAVLLEDSVATTGVVVAGLAIWLTEVTGNPLYDAAGAIIVGLLLGLVALWLGYKNRTLLLGPAMPKEVWEGVLAYLQEHPAVDQVRKPKSRIVGAGEFRFAAQIDFNGRYLGRKQAAWVESQSQALAEGDAEARQAFAEAFGERIVTAVAEEVDAIERELVARYPELIHVDLEAD